MYINYEDVVARYSMLESWGKSPTEVNSDLIFYAEAELNGLLAPSFTVPFSSAYPTVKDLAIELTYCKALFTKDPKEATERRKNVYDRIEGIKASREYIYTDSGTIIPPSSPGGSPWSSTEDYIPTHTMLGSEDDRVDPTLLEDLAGDR